MTRIKQVSKKRRYCGKETKFLGFVAGGVDAEPPLRSLGGGGCRSAGRSLLVGLVRLSRLSSVPGRSFFFAALTNCSWSFCFRCLVG